MERYIMHGVEPGGFLRAVLENNLKEACMHADDENRYLLFDYVFFLYNEAPSTCWGSSQAVDHWIAIGGYEGAQRVVKSIDRRLP
jgi:hypothetical protein